MIISKKNIRWIESDDDIEVDKESNKSSEVFVMDDIPHLDNYQNSVKINFPCNILISGGTNSGKTNVLLHIVQRNATQFNKIIALCPTASVNKDNQYGFLPKGSLFTNVNVQLIEKIFEYQKKHKNEKLLLILDDIIGVLDLQKAPIIQLLFTQSRHWNISLVVLTQNLKACSPCVRSNSRYLFITSLKEHSMKSAFELSNNSFPSFNMFKVFMNKMLKNYQCVRISLASYNEDRDYSVFKPPIASKFKILF